MPADTPLAKRSPFATLRDASPPVVPSIVPDQSASAGRRPNVTAMIGVEKLSPDATWRISMVGPGGHLAPSSITGVESVGLFGSP